MNLTTTEKMDLMDAKKQLVDGSFCPFRKKELMDKIQRLEEKQKVKK